MYSNTIRVFVYFFFYSRRSETNYSSIRILRVEHGANSNLNLRSKILATVVYRLINTFNSLLILFIFSFRLLSVLRGHSFFFIPTTTANDLRLRRIFYPRFHPLHLFSYLNSWERASIFPFECSVPNKGTTGTIFITSLVWRGPWLGIEPGTSGTRSQHYTTRLSRRRYSLLIMLE